MPPVDVSINHSRSRLVARYLSFGDGLLPSSRRATEPIHGSSPLSLTHTAVIGSKLYLRTSHLSCEGSKQFVVSFTSYDMDGDGDGVLNPPLTPPVCEGRKQHVDDITTLLLLRCGIGTMISIQPYLSYPFTYLPTSVVPYRAVNAIQARLAGFIPSARLPGCGVAYDFQTSSRPPRCLRLRAGSSGIVV